MTRGLITDIHRASVVDGPGLRTTVFVKGCSLRCVWCHNPETQKGRIEPAIDRGVLTPSEAEALGLDGFPETAEGTRAMLEVIQARGLDVCQGQLSSGALTVYGREVTVDAVMEEVRKDRDYYVNSGGGVTLSGGEPMIQPEFTLEVMGASKAEGIHTVLDTTGYMDRGLCASTLEVTDLYLYDFKASEEPVHQELTGVGLERILGNLDLLATSGARIWLRCPIIPGLNDAESHFQAIAKLQQKYPAIERVHLLTWHTMGLAKFKRLGKPVPAELPADSVEEVTKVRYREALVAAGGESVEVF